jgi:hypothetical protein
MNKQIIEEDLPEIIPIDFINKENIKETKNENF